MCSFHGLTKNIQTVLYAFLVSCRSRNPAAYLKDSSMWQYLKRLPAVTAVLYQIIVINPQKLLAFVKEFTFGFRLKILRKYNWIITAVWRRWILEVYQLISSLIYDWTTDPLKTCESEAAIERCSAYWVKKVVGKFYLMRLIAEICLKLY